ncbi:MAG TPA: two-component regulator propeller domain-containing protein [Cyclobacteriaceae bacterium]|nr:two-component regulator propeller domain-containing protein [Cyclobacteriaceae bacterium]
MNFFCAPVIALLLCTLSCSAQDAIFKNYNEQNGLPSSEVYHLFEDHDGFIWFATDNGVVRFDGGEFKLFDKSNGLADAVVFSISEDPHQNLWFRTFAGVTSTYSNGKMTPYKYNNLLKLMRGGLGFNGLFADSIGQVYVSTTQYGFFKITADGALRALDTPGSAASIIRVTDKDYLVGYIGSLTNHVGRVLMNGKSYSLVVRTDEPGQILCKRWRNNMYFSIRNGIFKLTGDEAKLVFVTKEPIISLSIDKEDNLWVGFLAAGVKRFSEGTFLHPWDMPLLKNRSVTSVLQHSDGSYWIATLEKGVYNIPNPKIARYSLSVDSKTNFTIATEKNVFVGYYNGVLTCLNKQTKKEDWSINLRKPIVAGVFLKEKNLLWVATSTYSVLLNNRGGIEVEHPFVPGKVNFFNVKKLFRTADRIWGVSGLGALEFDLDGKFIAVHEIPFWSRNILVNGDDIYLAGITGLHKTDKTFQKVEEIKEFMNDKVSDLALLPDHRILVSTAGSGFKIIDGQKIKSFSKKSGLIFENIYSTAVDHRSLWLATEKGLLKVDLVKLLNTGVFNYEQLDRNSGLSSNKLNSILRGGDETWCFHNDGFSVFRDREFHFANQHPIPRLNSVSVNSKPVDSLQLLDLSFRDNNIEFDFGFQSYDNRNIFLRHRAKASDHWNYTEDFIVNYHAMAPGDYGFEVEYSTDRAHWKRITFPGRVVIRPVWWETIYFRLVIMLVTAMIIFIYFRSKYQARLLQLELADKLKAEKERIAQDLHDNIGSKLVSLSLGLNNVVKEYEIAPHTAEMIYTNVNTTVLELRDTIWAIQKEGITISEFCDKIKNLVWRLRQNNGSVQYDLQIRTEKEGHVLKPTQAINLYRIVQESIANSQKHSGASEVVILICQTLSDDYLTIKVEDNGKGFVFKGSMSSESYGLKNMEARASEVNASLEIQSKVGEGTRVLTSLRLSG